MRAFRPEEGMARLSRLRLIEIGVAVALTMAALLFVAWAAWATEFGTISITEAWARPTIGQGKTTAAYMTIANTGDSDDVLMSVRSPKAKVVEIHETKMSDDGVMRMRPVEDGLAITAGGTVKLSPGGYHVMVMGLGEALVEGSDLPLTLAFEKAGAVEMTIPVRAGGAQGHH